jgi:hypothetical protein
MLMENRRRTDASLMDDLGQSPDASSVKIKRLAPAQSANSPSERDWLRIVD